MTVYESDRVTNRVTETVLTDRPVARQRPDGSHSYDRFELSGGDIAAAVLIVVMILGPMFAGAFGLGA